jgi:hypothetical protein
MKFSMTGQEKGGLSIQVTELLYFYKDNKMSEFHLLFLHKNNPENCLIIQLNIEDIKVYKIYFSREGGGGGKIYHICYDRQ